MSNHIQTLEYLVTAYKIELEHIEHYLTFGDGKKPYPSLVGMYHLQLTNLINETGDVPEWDTVIKGFLSKMDGNFFANSPLKMKLLKKSDLLHDAEGATQHMVP